MIRHAMSTLATLLLCSVAPHAPAQSCGPDRILLKNDSLPDVPSGQFAVGIVPGLCINEAAMSILQVGGPATVHEVAVMFGQAQGTAGVQAVVDVEIYDGATLNPNGTYTMGPRLFRLSDGGSNLQIQTHAINTFTLPTPVRVPGGTVVVGFRMIQTLASGSCQFGYTSNFCVDAANTCPRGRNILDAIGHGPVDPNSYQGFGIGLCPTFFRGDWIIRACVEPELSVSWTGNTAPGGFVQVTYNAPGHGGEIYLGLGSNSIGTGVQTPWGRLPLNQDWLFDCLLGDCRSQMLISAHGFLDSQGRGFGGLVIPNLPVLAGSNLHIYLGFVTGPGPFPNIFPWTGISAPSAPIIVN